MRLKFHTLDNKYYYTNPLFYKIKWDGKSPSKIQFEAKQFFKQIWFRDLVCEEFPVKPKLELNYRFDFINLTKRVICEVHGSEAHSKYSPYFHKDEEDFWDGLERDRSKQLWADKNQFQFVELYPKNFPIDLEWLKKRYPLAKWPKLL